MRNDPKIAFPARDPGKLAGELVTWFGQPDKSWNFANHSSITRRDFRGPQCSLSPWGLPCLPCLFMDLTTTALATVAS